MGTRIRALSPAVPPHLGSPLSLAIRLLKTRDAAAYFAMGSAALSTVVSPLDMLLQSKERKLYQESPGRSGPLVFVIGAPRSGTTVCQQHLLRYLPFAYLSNFTSLFPRSPLAACQLFRKTKPTMRNMQNYYGKTIGWDGPNDALYIWDRWTNSNRRATPQAIDDEAKLGMQRFFAACESVFQQPLLNKVNNLLGWANLANEILPNSYFLCMQRSDLYLAQSLYRARLEIMGDDREPYGLIHPGHDRATDPFESVAEQVDYYNSLIDQQEAAIGSSRFWRVPYEHFCAAPHEIVSRVGQQVFGSTARINAVPPISHRNRQRVSSEAFSRLQAALRARGLGEKTVTALPASA